MATEPATKPKPQRRRCTNQPARARITIEETGSGDIVIPAEAYAAIERQIAVRISFPDLSHVTTVSGYDRRPKFELLTFVEPGQDSVGLRSRASSYIVKLLIEAGYEVNCHRPHLPEQLCSMGTDVEYRLLSPVARDRINLLRFGQIGIESNEDVVAMVADIVQGYPHVPFVLPCPTEKQAREFGSDLGTLLNEAVDFQPDLKSSRTSRITVCTPSAGNGCGLMDGCAVIFPFWPGSIDEWMKTVARICFRERIYLIRTPSDRVSRTDEDELFRRIGPMILDLWPVAPTVQHEVHTVSFGGSRPPGKARLPIEKRHAYWNHGRRNQALASVAREIGREFLPNASSEAPGPSIAILVEVPEQGRQVAALLDGWPLVTLDSPAGPLPSKSIVTLSAAASLKSFRPDWLIFGMGGPPSPWLCGWLDQCASLEHSVHVVDLTDEFNHKAAALAQARQEDLKQHNAHWRPLSNAIVKVVLGGLRDSSRPSKRIRNVVGK